jgi:bifunctional DNA-binding transcriptional regulator/antitoxin component of YhaV-PrlF toxin-antitoxin module
MSAITGKGRVTIPTAIRDHLDVDPGSERGVCRAQEISSQPELP